MATYLELHSLWANDSLRNRIAVACIVATDTIRLEDVGTVNHANRLTWAKLVLGDPQAQAKLMLMAVLAQNKALATEAILAASDAALQTAVGNAINMLATG
jgi:hypothetical protein